MKHTVLIWTAIASSLLFNVACNKGLNDESQDGDTAEESSDWTATTQVKTKEITVASWSDLNIVYQDFTYQYKIGYYQTKPVLKPFMRKGTSFSNEAWAKEYGRFGSMDYDNAGIVTLGPVAGLSSITSKEIDVPGKMHGHNNSNISGTWGDPYYFLGEDLVPNAGYYMYYRKENNEFDFVRLFVSNYKMDGDGNITSITIKYQMY